MKPLLSLVFIAFFFAPALAADPIVQKDIPYLGADRKEKADVYSPTGNRIAPCPAVLLIHGGGWVGGDKANKESQRIATTLAAAGYVVFAINYQLGGNQGNPPVFKSGWPQNIYDCKSALRYMRKQAKQFDIDPRRIAVMGGSAGGHLALLLGSTAHVIDLNQGGLYTDQSDEVSCIIDFYGISDLSSLIYNKLTPRFGGTTDAARAENLRRASPMTYISAQTPPILIAHGTNDQLVPVDMSRHLAEQLKQMGTSCQYVEVPGAIHGFDLQPPQMDLRPVVLAFLKKYLGTPRPFIGS